MKRAFVFGPPSGGRRSLAAAGVLGFSLPPVSYTHLDVYKRQIDLVVGPDNIPELPALVMEQMAGGPPVARTEFDLAAPRFLTASPEPGGAPVVALVTTMKGCDERCSFCIVPYTRGPERYRPAREVVDEAKRFVMAGSREILLLGQTVDSFRDPELPPPEADPVSYTHLGALK